MWRSIYILSLIYCIANAITYNSYYRVPATEEEIAEFEARGVLSTCTVNHEPCDENEGRRVDGSCNNLKYPSHGMFHTPELRLLPADFGEGYTLRKISDGQDFPLARFIRSMVLKVGDGIDQKFSTATSYFMEFVFGDIGSIHDIENYILETPYCCKPEGLSNPMCAPNFIPVNDPVHRFSGNHCINMTKPKTFQTEGCAPSNTEPNRITKATTHMDLSSTYLHGDASAIADHRTYEGGKLKVEVVNGISLPSDAVEGTTCFIKQARETSCRRNVPNTILGTNLFATWFWRFHNFVAEELAKLNPCWDDEKLFNVAMDINIACYNQIVFYELFAELLGREHMINKGILGCDEGHRDLYDEDIIPGLYNEYNYVMRWYHVTQDGTQEKYDADLKYKGTIPMVNFTLRVQDLAYDNNMVDLTHGIFMQPAGGFNDGTIHPDMADLGLGPWQKTFDILTNDLAKGRYNGLTSYLQYRDFCTNYERKHETFEDLEYLMNPEQIEELRRTYGDPRHIEFMAGVWSERTMEGAWVPPTVHCITLHQLIRFVVSDRHWYERPNRPCAFTIEQLRGVRNSSFAYMLCTVGDEVKKIQPKAFLRVGEGNEVVSCEEIPKIDFSPWKENCDKK